MIYGIGVNDADYSVYITEKVGTTKEGKPIRKNTWKCPYYSAWSGMMTRVYSGRYPSYAETTVDPSWHKFSVFKSWMEKQDWEGLALDKDILGDGTIYSEATCRFIPHYLNMLLAGCYQTSDSLIGTTYKKALGKYQAACGGGRNKWIGCFHKQEDAHRAWQIRKAEDIRFAIEKYIKSDKFDISVIEGLSAKRSSLLCSVAEKQITRKL